MQTILNGYLFLHPLDNEPQAAPLTGGIHR